jgi:hypothetical protein
MDITPFLKPEQAFQTLMLTFASSTVGCIYPALKSAKARYMELTLNPALEKAKSFMVKFQVTPRIYNRN